MDLLNNDENLDEGLLKLLFDENIMEDFPEFPTVDLDFNILPSVLPTTSNTSFEQTQGRFRTVSTEDVEHFLETNQNKNTKRKTVGDTSLFQSFLLPKGEMRCLEFIPPDLLNQYLCEFLLSVTKKDGTEYEPTSIRSIVGSVDRYLRSKNYQYSIISSVEFAKSRQVMKSKQKQLKSLGKGNKSKAADPIDEELIEKFHECGTLGDGNPEAVIHSMWMVCTLHFGMRTGQEAHNLRWGDIQLKEDSLGEYLIYDTERQTKTRTGINVRDTRLSKPRAYAIPDKQKDPVHLYKIYSSNRPDEMQDPDSPFFLSVANKKPTNLQAWFKKQAMGINKIYGIMKEMKIAADIDSDKRITPYSVRKHLIQKLNDNGVPSHHIMQISGHKNVNSLNNYSKLNPGQSKGISDILANKNGISETNERSVVPLGTSYAADHEKNLPASLHRSVGFEHQHFPMLAHSTFNGPVTFNFDNTSSRTMNQTAVSHSQYNSNAGSHEQTSLMGSLSVQASPVCSPQPRRWKRIRCISSSSDSE